MHRRSILTSKPSIFKFVLLACSKYNKIYTHVELPRGGYLVVKKPLFPQFDNKIIVYGHDNNYMGYGYDCGYKEKISFDF